MHGSFFFQAVRPTTDIPNRKKWAIVQQTIGITDNYRPTVYTDIPSRKECAIVQY